jgi:hypothetical protein
MSDEQPQKSLDDVITAACRALVGDFERLNGLIVEPHPEMSPRDVAVNLVEIGRGQISGEARSSEEDQAFIPDLVAGLDLEGTLAHRFCAYLSGCVLGWVALGELPPVCRDDALAVVRARSVELFPPDSTGSVVQGGGGDGQ